MEKNEKLTMIQAHTHIFFLFSFFVFVDFLFLGPPQNGKRKKGKKNEKGNGIFQKKRRMKPQNKK